MPQAVIGKWGNSLALRLPSEVVEAARLRDGERVNIEAQNGSIVIHRAAPQFSLEELFAGKTAEEWRAAYADAFDWGPDVGREIIEE